MDAYTRFSAPVPQHDAERVATLNRYAILDTPPEQAFDDITEIAAYICAAPYSTITLVDRDRQWFKSEVGFGTNETGRDDGFCACAVLQSTPMVIEDTLLDPRFCANPFVTGGPQIRFYAGAPLVAPNGHILGTVCVFDSKPRTLEQKQLHALEALARQVMSQMELRLKLIENEKAALAVQTAEKLAAVGRLASSLSHEINNPLAAVTNLLYLARLDESLKPETRAYLETADTELSRVATVATHTLRFHRQSTKPTRIAVVKLVEDAMTLFEARFKNFDICVDQRLSAGLQLTCYEGEIRQLLNSLVGNAVDAMRASGTLTVRAAKATRWSTGEEGVRITVADGGCGMSAETLAHAFEAFFTTKDIQGTGLGLWVSRQIAAQHGGSIEARSRMSGKRRGSTFALWLPLSLRVRA
ncbi:MAG: GAF domain-containing sensor histidine kinase [Acidobacteriaceae bacterium]|nr:GAF domain-containing sensor histidine kinase [Acidobacteriaceae bacterium]